MTTPEPPRRGRPRKEGVKMPVRLDPDVRADLDRAVVIGRARSISEEINRRCKERSVPEIIESIVSKLRFESGYRGYYADCPDRRALIAALSGESETETTVIDLPYSGRRWIVLSPLEFEEHPIKRGPLLVETPTHICRPSDPVDNGQDGDLADWEKAMLSGGGGPHVACAQCTDRTPRLAALGWTGRHDQLSTVEVAQWFAGRAVGVDWDPGHPTEAPAAGDSFARVTIAGDLGEVVDTTDDSHWEGNHYRWYDLTDVPVGGSVWRLSSTDTLWLFTRREADRWEVTVVPDAQWAHTRDGHPVDAILAGIRMVGAVVGAR